jgi:hypothetical protein
MYVEQQTNKQSFLSYHISKQTTTNNKHGMHNTACLLSSSLLQAQPFWPQPVVRKLRVIEWLVGDGF